MDERKRVKCVFLSTSASMMCHIGPCDSHGPPCGATLARVIHKGRRVMDTFLFCMSCLLFLCCLCLCLFQYVFCLLKNKGAHGVASLVP